MNIQPIVEGHGDVRALPVLLRRFVAEGQVWEIGVGRPIRRRRDQLVRENEVKRAVELARIQPDCAAIPDFCSTETRIVPPELGPAVQAWAQAAARGVPCRVVLAHREYEAWFLAAIESLRGYRGVRDDAQPHGNPEEPRGAKGQLEARMRANVSYLETTDQPAFSEKFSLPDAYHRSRSFRKLTSAFGFLARSMGQEIEAWPPPAWI